jgi:predicted RNase H-like HicB family nuclease
MRLRRLLRKRKVKKLMQKNWTYILEREPEGGWFIKVYELPGCMSQGETPDEAMYMIQDAMVGWFETVIDYGSHIPEPKENIV